LFRPKTLEVRAAPGAASLAGGAPLEGAASVRVHLSDHRTLRVTARDGGEADFVLSVPGRIARRFRGTLDIRPAGDRLLALLHADLETAVATVTAAESGPGAPREALKTQAVLARSFFLAAGRRHTGFDFCDTTHCQFFRSPPPAKSSAARAARDTRGLVLTYRGRVFAPLYSANCGGRTRLPRDIGLRVTIYPYFAVNCVRRGPRRGHAVGLCQAGAMVMARGGKDFRAILNYYFPGTAVEQDTSP
jgi:peptidoglycan hydrolase-like amidase